jgi:tetratricopeptide (TPR) repeat protein
MALRLCWKKHFGHFSPRTVAKRNTKLRKKIFLVCISVFICSAVFAQSKADLFEKGVEFLMQEKYQNAVDAFTLFIKIDPDNAFVYKNRGVAYMKMKEYDMAIEDFQKAKELAPGLQGTASNLGVAWYCKKEYEKAIKNYTAEINRTPEESFLFFNRALCYADLDQNQKALEDLSRTLELKPDFHLAHCLKGDLLMKMKRSGEAQTAYEKATTITHVQEKLKQLKEINKTEETKKQTKKNYKSNSQSKQKKEKRVQIATPKLKDKFAIQVGAFQNKAYALKTEEKLAQNGYDSRILTLNNSKGKTWYLVRVGLFSTHNAATPLILSMKEKMSLNVITRPAGRF